MAPVKETPEIVRAAVPVFLSVTGCAADVEPTLAEAKERMVGETLTTGTPTPVPLRATVCTVTVLEALSAMLSEADAAPVAVGWKVTEIVQEALAASDVPQVLVCEKAAALAPVKETLEIVRGAVPVFLSVTGCAADVEPTLVDAKVRLVGERLTAGVPPPVPLRVTVCGELGAVS